ncbi:MAG: hypothetical protein Q4C72_09345 [Eubacteriales bacterium]|nr:hypothetical protein [Eubacteriales bacterium]
MFSVYFNHKGLDFGYHFRAGGTLPSVTDGVAAFALDGYDTALCSLNRPRVCRIEAAGETRSVDPDRPFAVVLPQPPGQLALYDEQGRAVPLSTQFL